MNSMNIGEVLRSENDEIKSFLSTSLTFDHTDMAKLQEILEEIFLKMRSHMAILEVVLFPEIQKKQLPESEAVDAQIKNHQDINKYIQKMEVMRLADGNNSNKIDKLKEIILDNIKFEEENIYPLLESSSLDLDLIELNFKNYRKRSNEIDGAHSV